MTTALPAFQTTTRLTSPEPTGAEKWLQDQWDSRREAQVRGHLSLPTDTAIRNFLHHLKIAIDRAAADPKEVITLYGSYDRTDKYKKNGDEDTGLTEEMETTLRRLGNDPAFLLSRYAKKKNVKIISRGVRTTSILKYADGTFDVMDPTKGIMVGDKELTDIKQIETLYAVLSR